MKINPADLRAFAPPGTQPGITPVETERRAVINASDSLLGMGIPYETDAAVIAANIGAGFAPYEIQPLEGAVDRRTVEMLRTHLYPQLRSGVKAGDEKILRYAHKVGRLLGALLSANLLDTEPPVQINDQKLHANQQSVPLALETGSVVDLGIGLNGIASHLENLKQKRYRVLGVTADRGETHLLQGVLEFNGVADKQAQFFSRGLANSLTWLKGRPSSADAVIASRLNGAGAPLLEVPSVAASVVCEGGILVARGLRRGKPVGYDKVTAAIVAEPNLEIEVDHRFTSRRARKDGPQRLVIARRVGSTD